MHDLMMKVKRRSAPKVAGFHELGMKISKFESFITYRFYGTTFILLVFYVLVAYLMEPFQVNARLVWLITAPQIRLCN